jgi:hypothetical protein
MLGLFLHLHLLQHIELPELLILLLLHRGLVKLQLGGLYLVKGFVAGIGRSLRALGYTIGFPK